MKIGSKIVNVRQLNPKRTLEPEKFIKFERSIKLYRLPAILNLISKTNLKICDIGGASGVFMDQILLNAKYNVYPFILDVDIYYKDKLVNSKIQFIHGSILDSQLKTNSFDIVTFRDLLHHLVSNNIKNTLFLQNFALNEIFRIVKKGGYVLFVEQVNIIHTFSKLIYILSKFMNKFRLKLDFFRTGRVVVFFLSSKLIEKLLLKYIKKYNLKILKRVYIPVKDLPIKWKLSLLMIKTGLVLYLIKVLKY